MVQLRHDQPGKHGFVCEHYTHLPARNEIFAIEVLEDREEADVNQLGLFVGGLLHH